MCINELMYFEVKISSVQKQNGYIKRCVLMFMISCDLKSDYGPSKIATNVKIAKFPSNFRFAHYIHIKIKVILGLFSFPQKNG